MEPDTRYALSGAVRVAYQVLGDGPRDLVLAPGFVSNLELAWERPSYERFMRRLATFARVIVFDTRGSGLSDPSMTRPRSRNEWTTSGLSWTQQAVCGRTCLAGLRAQRWPPCSAPAVRIVSQRSSFTGRLRGVRRAEGYPWGLPREVWELGTPEGEQEIWGQGFSLMGAAPSGFEDEALVRWWGRFERQR